MGYLASWLLTAMLSWTGSPDPTDADACARFELAHRESVASFDGKLAEIAQAVEASPLGGSYRDALYLVAIPFEESGFRRWVDDGSCNTRTGYVPKGEWNCDGGRAYTVWQFRPDTWWTPPGKTPVTGADLLGDRQLAANKAWEKFRANPAAWATWPKARELADRWFAAHSPDLDGYPATAGTAP